VHPTNPSSRREANRSQNPDSARATKNYVGTTRCTNDPGAPAVNYYDGRRDTNIDAETQLPGCTPGECACVSINGEQTGSVQLDWSRSGVGGAPASKRGVGARTSDLRHRGLDAQQWMSRSAARVTTSTSTAFDARSQRSGRAAANDGAGCGITSTPASLMRRRRERSPSSRTAFSDVSSTTQLELQHRDVVGDWRLEEAWKIYHALVAIGVGAQGVRAGRPPAQCYPSVTTELPHGIRCAFRSDGEDEDPDYRGRRHHKWAPKIVLWASRTKGPYKHAKGGNDDGCGTPGHDRLDTARW